MPSPPLPRLLVSRAEAKEKITAQIDRGLEITHTLEPTLSGFGFAQSIALGKAAVEREKWAKFTLDLLNTLFVDLPTGKEFGSWEITYNSYNKTDQGRQLLQRTIEWLHSLESIIERLDLFPLVGKPVQATTTPASSKQQSSDIFIVHGHDEAAKLEVWRFIEKLSLHPIILHEEPDRGKTIIEKFEHHSDVGFAVVLLTPDDVGHPKDILESKPRARQNVVLELGYFIGKLGRSRVCALMKGGIEIPTDLSGILFTPMDDAGAWKLKLAREIREAHIEFDFNNAL